MPYHPPTAMKLSEAFPYTFRNLRRQLGLAEPSTQPMVEACRADDSAFCLELQSEYQLTGEQVRRAAERYRLGKSRSGQTLFWMIDEGGTVRDGFISATPRTWVSQVFRQRCPELARYIRPEHCFVGQHLLGTQPVGIVASERSAVILSEVMPQMTWLASVYPMNLTVELFSPLQGRVVTLFPATDATMDTWLAWCELADQVRRSYDIDIRVSSLLEDRATAEQKARGIDLAGFIFPRP